MRNLIFFFYKYYTFFLFFALEIIAFIILFRFNNYQKASFLNYTGSVSSGFYGMINSTTEYFNLKTLNDSLQKENARLRSQLLNAYYQNGFNTTKINDTVYKQQYQYISGSIVNNSINKRNNYITIDKGRLHGVTPEMGVIGPNGIVGIVMSVSDHFSVVLSLLNNNAKISAMIEKNGAFGSLVWDGDDPKFAKLNDVNKHVPIAPGDQIVTSSYSTIFPRGIPIGRINSHTLDAGDNFHTIKIELFTDFNTLRSVYIITNLLKGEQQALEGSSILKN